MVDTTSALEQLKNNLAPLSDALVEHSIYRDIDNVDKLRVLMEHHVFAVWDFMSLLKTLQQRLCGGVPWLPPQDPAAARFINEIVLAEETDEASEGGYASHFDLYQRAMRSLEVSTREIDRFVMLVRDGHTIDEALLASGAPSAVHGFVRHTFRQIEEAETCELAAAFTFGREELLPRVFERIVEGTNHIERAGLADLRYYLVRHIDLDGDHHGPMAERLVATLCGNDPQKWQAAENAARASLLARQRLWDGVHEAVASLSGTTGYSD